MEDKHVKASGWRRSLFSGAALGTAAALAFGGLVATPAFAAPGGSATGTGTNEAGRPATLTLTPGQGLNPDGDTTLALSGTNYATKNAWGQSFGGAYLLFGVIDKKNADDAGSWAPSKGGASGKNYDYAAGAGVYQSMINYPGNSTEPGLGYMDQSGNWQSTLTIPGAKFTSQAGNEIDCLDSATQCGVITVGAHGAATAGVEVFTPVTFAEENWEAVAPTITTQPGDVSVAVGADASFEVVATGDPAPTYQWQSRANADAAWAAIEGATSATLSLNSVTEADNGRQFRVQLANEAGELDSAAATLTVTEAAPEPTGTSTGAPYAGNTAYMVVTPGEQLRVNGTTSITVEGHGYDPSAPIYVGLGTMKNFDEPENWRRSNGGTSGPVGLADYSYGAPRFIGAHGTTDGSVADAEMTADGSWSFTMTVPGAAVQSFFGDTIACDTLQCGFFSFGAHGQVKAANEAFVPVYFGTQTPPVPAAVATETTVAPQQSGEYPTHFAGKNVALSATVNPASAAGIVEFFAGETSLGQATVENGAAEVATDKFVGGAQQVHAVFTPADAAAYEASSSPAQTFRIVDLTPAVAPITVGAASSVISGAQLNWSVANYVSFGSGPAKSVLGGNVTLAELPENATTADLANREFVFSGGEGVQDAAGNSVVSFDGEVQLTSGSVPEWNFRQPTVHTNAAGDGYITAEVDGIYRGSIFGGEDVAYGPVRVTLTTFTGATSADADGTTTLSATPLFQGQVAAGTWAGEYTGATFTNEFLQYLNSGVRAYFYESGTTGANLTKPGRPVALSYQAEAIPAPEFTVTPTELSAVDGGSIRVTGANIDASAMKPWGTPAPAGMYVSLGWISNDGWKPSEGNAGTTRAAVATRWVQETEPTDESYVQWERGANGRANFEFTFDDVTLDKVNALKPATGSYRLAVFAIGAGGVVQPVNEFAQDVTFVVAETTTEVADQASGDVASDFAGQDVTVSATVAPAAAAGTVEFFAGTTSLGSATVANGAASVTTKQFAGGAHQVTAVFTPENAAVYQGSTSAAKTFRVIDLARAVADITVGEAAENISGASFGWSVANYYSSFGYAFGKEAIGEGVSVPEEVAGDKEFNSNRLFTFTGGTGTRDAAGNAVISFTGPARVPAGDGSRWDFRDPQLHVNAKGDGYVTAEFSGFFRMDGLANVDYAPKRVTVATFTGAQLQVAEGKTDFTVSPIWENQVAAGTFAGDYTGAFPSEFASLLYTGIRAFFTQTGTSGANLTKPVQPIVVSFESAAVPVDPVNPVEPVDPVKPVEKPAEQPAGGDNLSATRAEAPFVAGGIALLLLAGGGVLLLTKRRKEHAAAE